MSIKNTPFSAAMVVALLSLNVTAQANDETSNGTIPENNDAVHNWMPQQPDNNFWQTPNWSSFNQRPATPESTPPAVTAKPAPQQPTIQAPALQFPAPDMPFATTMPGSSPTMAPHISSGAPSAISSETAPANSTATAETSQNRVAENMPAMNIPPQMPGYNNNYRPPMPQPYYNQAPQYNPYQRPYAAPMYPPMQNGHRPYPPANMYQGYRPHPNMQHTQPYMPNGAPAYNMPGYNRYNNNGWGNNGWGNNNWGNNNWGNNFWGQSGPGTWTNPNKQNMEQAWDDMINAPGRMGTMPGGWNAPEITMPNPVDMGDQFQENIQDLPDQIRNMDVGN